MNGKKIFKGIVTGLLIVASVMTIANGVSDYKADKDKEPDTNIETEVEATE